MEKAPLPDAYLPLYRPEVRAATGLSAGLLKRLILSGATQFGAGVVQVFVDGRKIHIRFNPKVHSEFIRSREV